MVGQNGATHAFRDLVARRTGFLVNNHVVRSIAEDARSLAAYMAHPGDREAERSDVAQAQTIDECFDFAKTYFGPGPLQHRSEITALLNLAEENGTRVVCEIGAFHAGTSVLFSRAFHPDTLIVMDLYTKNRWRLRRAAPPGQMVHIIDGDSTQPLVIERLRRKLRGRQLDLLFIDGDHRFDGVRNDFLNYRGFVRDGGLIAFHDICEVRDRKPYSGDVPTFWRLLRPLYESHEFVDSENQDGLGIGVIRYDARRSVDSVREAVAPSG
jgi:cephalosporin hydroxylase